MMPPQTNKKKQSCQHILALLRMLTLIVNVLWVNCVTVAYGKRPPSEKLQNGDTHGNQTDQVEHCTVEAFQSTRNKEIKSSQRFTFMQSFSNLQHNSQKIYFRNIFLLQY